MPVTLKSESSVNRQFTEEEIHSFLDRVAYFLAPFVVTIEGERELDCHLRGPACLDPPLIHQAFLYHEPKKEWVSRCVRMGPHKTKTVTIVGKLDLEGQLYVASIQPGPFVPRDLRDPELRTDKEMMDSAMFWAVHAWGI